MSSYVVMEPPVADADAGRERAVLVSDGFHVLAFLVPALWLLWHRLWIEALAVIAVTMALSGFGSVLGLGNAAPALAFLVSLYVGLEGPALRLAALRRRGWRAWGLVEAGDAAEAEIRYLNEAEGEAGEPAAAGPSLVSAPPVAAPRPLAAPALGLFAYPGKS
ncbi:MAG: DUF2628 domain-containing protein [Aquamicrobium sp.]|uniref:DUF2628 domain-containing protein n=1 Tax=Aquamicrobium sp. TaxID=1872579 RepID=UPI00349E69D2|nr:DUF2628 domain-containing protein [Aquamicrobium sp.]